MMPNIRASVFGEDADSALDVGAFSPKTSIDTEAPPVEKVKEVSKAAQFSSRQPVAPKPEKQHKRLPRVYRTGRNVQFGAKASQKTIDSIYDVTAQQDWVLGETLENAIEALKRELARKK
ncbi:hypothetical protein [Terracidiphilus sp.]|jgi:hypothetical protein|uniref:hypothetical protein n=1 Tax=Terracidiphilus sp. TaxID=1964191 RepID=UPI003C1360CB